MKALRVRLFAVLLALIFGNNVFGQLGRQQDLIDPNVASEKELLALPHLNAAIVKTVMEKRPFLSVTELNAVLVPVLKPAHLAELYKQLFIHINLNSATNEEMLLIPGMGKRMVHEFEEYRPYKTLAQFRQEIGKYVDEKEVARLEQYVFIPINLNTASDEDILSIPGSGRRVLHEFKEYRPYTSLEQFRGEMGKYWDAKEVARLERYVVVE